MYILVIKKHKLMENFRFESDLVYFEIVLHCVLVKSGQYAMQGLRAYVKKTNPAKYVYECLNQNHSLNIMKSPLIFRRLNLPPNVILYQALVIYLVLSPKPEEKKIKRFTSHQTNMLFYIKS